MSRDVGLKSQRVTKGVAMTTSQTQSQLQHRVLHQSTEVRLHGRTDSGLSVEVYWRTRHEGTWTREGRKATQVYVSGEELVMDLGPKPEGEYTPRGEDPTVDKAWDAYNRKIGKANVIAAELAMEVIRSEFVKMLLPIEGTALIAGGKYKRNAGCSCGCSPGVVLQPVKGETAHLKYGGKIVDLFVRIESLAC